jgi:hypothetical protein
VGVLIQQPHKEKHMAMKINKTDEKVFSDLADKAADALSNLRDFITDVILDPRREELDGWSEKRKEGDKGQAAEAFLAEWEQFRDDLPEFDTFPSMDPEG